MSLLMEQNLHSLLLNASIPMALSSMGPVIKRFWMVQALLGCR